ncbi:mannose-P-dolichol utilization defect 1 protein-like isoform X3 [Cyclopterus lumpus]|nr:mannose-P-dolichol utilization defect 1 protein-like isoform X3 [Cyclopterus lumpus]
MAQLLKIVWSRSAEGLSLASVLLQLYAVSCPVVYAVANNFPFFAWGERLFILAYTAATVFLILHYRGDTLTGFLVLLAYGNVMFLLGSYAAAAVASVMQASSLTALIASKVLQARANHCNGHTGQLSILSVLLTCAGSLVILVSLQETGSLFTTLSQALSAGLSFVLLAQVLCSSGSTATTKANTYFLFRFNWSSLIAQSSIKRDHHCLCVLHRISSSEENIEAAEMFLYRDVSHQSN